MPRTIIKRQKKASTFTRLFSYIGWSEVDTVLLENIYEINYFVIDFPYDTEAVFLGTNTDLVSDNKSFIKSFLLANQGNEYSQHDIGSIYKEQNNLIQAKRYFNLASSKGNRWSKVMLYAIYIAEGNTEQADNILTQIDPQDYEDAQFTAAGCILENNKEDWERALPFLKQCKNFLNTAANAGSDFAQIILARLYLEEGDLEQYFNYVSQALQEGNESLKELAADIKLKLNNAEQMDWQEHEILQFVAGSLAISKENGSAFHFFKQCKNLLITIAKKGDTDSQLLLALLYLEENNLEQSKYYALQAAQQGSTQAQQLLASIESRLNQNNTK